MGTVLFLWERGDLLQRRRPQLLRGQRESSGRSLEPQPFIQLGSSGNNGLAKCCNLLCLRQCGPIRYSPTRQSYRSAAAVGVYRTGQYSLDLCLQGGPRRLPVSLCSFVVLPAVPLPTLRCLYLFRSLHSLLSLVCVSLLCVFSLSLSNISPMFDVHAPCVPTGSVGSQRVPWLAEHVMCVCAQTPISIVT